MNFMQAAKKWPQKHGKYYYIPFICSYMCRGTQAKEIGVIQFFSNKLAER